MERYTKNQLLDFIEENLPDNAECIIDYSEGMDSGIIYIDYDFCVWLAFIWLLACKTTFYSI